VTSTRRIGSSAPARSAISSGTRSTTGRPRARQEPGRRPPLYPERFGVAVEPFNSTAEAVATFPETASCVGLRLRGERLEIVAPYGLDDLFDLVCRHNPTRVPAAFYTQRVEEKGWRERWPRLTVVAA
jgi:hypothetical protein